MGKLSQMTKAELIEINVWIDDEKSTDAAYYCTDAFGKRTWIAKSQVKTKEPIKNKDNKFRLGIPEWLFDKLEWKI